MFKLAEETRSSGADSFCCRQPSQSQSDFFPSNSNSYELTPLKLYWNGRTDNMTTTAPLDQQDTVAGYQFVRIEGYIFTRHADWHSPAQAVLECRARRLPAHDDGAVGEGCCRRLSRLTSRRIHLSITAWRAFNLEFVLPAILIGGINFVAASAEPGLDHAFNTDYHYVRTEGCIISDCH